MPELGPENGRLEALRQRWERDHNSRLFLQLAEEYRRQGRLAEATRVLESGLAVQPGYLAARVALGRCRLEAGDPQGACQTLEVVLASDPTQLVANKLLIEAYLQTARPDQARDRLDLYVLLNESDPEIDDLERRLLAAEGTGPESPEREVPAELPEAVMSRPTLEGSTDVALGHATPAERLALSASVPSETPLALPVLTTPAFHLGNLPLPSRARHRQPEGGLWPPFPALNGPDDLARVTAALLAGGIFRGPGSRAVPAEPVPEALPEVLEVSEPLPPAVGLEAPYALAEEAIASPVAEPGGVDLARTLEAPLPKEWWRRTPDEGTPEPQPAVAERTSVVRAEVAPEPLPESAGTGELAVPFVAPQESDSLPGEVTGLQAVELPEPLELLEVAEHDAGQATASAATSTLGELYLEQGHYDEAESVFREVLSRDPGNLHAVAGIDEIGRQRSARSLGADDRIGESRPAAGLTAQKIQVLTRYLERIREGARRHVS